MTDTTSLKETVPAARSRQPRDATLTSETIDSDGNVIQRGFVPGADRYLFDFDLCHPALGWVQWDTTLDGPGFGIWVHLGKREIVTFSQGERSRCRCPDQTRLGRLLSAMESQYGPPPAIAVGCAKPAAAETFLGSRIDPALVVRMAAQVER